ncbi:hypothetical protein Pcinc_033562 [Petrolisthes cinctipes]|uniref:Uncharacterized protein n=1 Tax=Petrolisthes cinctipes TaxID=88211 RepID=A0AAE1JYH4_PETCI|nr:hypothetical protein Pcinc_033562 [Petrolisthes cinctipes]
MNIISLTRKSVSGVYSWVSRLARPSPLSPLTTTTPLPSCGLPPGVLVAGHGGGGQTSMCRDDPQPHPALLMMGSDQYCLKWNNHWANLIRVFNSLLQSETFVDVTLACEGRHLKAHRLVLSACSPYFKELLVAHPDKHPIVILKDVRYSELRTLIEFIYNGEVSVEQQDLAALLCTARELQIKGLADNRLPGAPHHQTSSKDPLGHFFTPTSIPVMPPTTHYSTSPPLDATIKGSSPRRKVGSEDRPPPPLQAIHSNISVSSTSIPCPSLLPTYRSRPSSRETSPAHKRLRRSPIGIEEDSSVTEATKDTQTDPPNGHLHPHQEHHNESHYIRLAGPSGLRLITNSNREDNNNIDTSWEADRGSPSMAKMCGDVSTSTATTTTATTTATTTTTSPGRGREDDTDDDRPHASPEVILEEGESGVVTSGPSPVTSPALAAPMAPAGPLPPQVAILHQALALGYHPLQHYFPPGLLDQQSQQQSQQQQHPGVSPPKELLHFLEMMKSVPGSGRLPLAALGGSAAVGGASSLALSLPGGSGATSTAAAAAAAAAAVAAASPAAAARDKNVGNGITCHICAMILPSPHHLEEHIRIHEEEKPYKCDQCGQRYKYQSAFQRHQEQNHTAKLPGDKPFRCSVCGQCFKYHKSFTKHRSNHDALDRMMKAEADENRLHPRCISESYLQKLLVSQSPKSEPDATITLKEEITDVSQDQSTDRPSTSNPTTFNTSLIHGVNPENGIKKYDDGEEEEEDGEIDPEDEDVEYEEENKGKFVYCVKCKLTFRDVVSFEGHCRGSPECSVDTLREVNVGESPGLSCPPSVASSPQASPRLSPSSLSGTPRSPLPASTPLAMPSPPSTTTPVGGLPPSSSVAMSTATASTHGSSTPPGQSSLFKMDSRGAIILPHVPPPTAPDPRGDEERPFKCQFCQKGFKGRENLKLHIRTHTGEKPYNCGVCGKAFGGRSDMNRHLRIHTGEKPYPCKVCGKKFARADYLSKHITTHLGVPFAKPVHSLQQSLQNLENMQNLQNLQKLQNMSNE